MTVDERNRLRLAEAAKRLLGDEEGITLMELLPPVGWADVATKQDLDARFGALDARFGALDARFGALDAQLDGLKHELQATIERELRGQTWKMFTVYAASMGAVIGALVAVAKF